MDLKTYKYKTQRTIEDAWLYLTFNKTVVNECWISQQPTDKDGYACIKQQGNWWRVHRLAYHINKGEIPTGLLVCHTCDNPSCFNPDHLFLGTALDNNKDRNEKGRSAIGKKNGAYTQPEKTRHLGEDNGSAKLTWDDVNFIRLNFVSGRTGNIKFLCDKYILSRGTIYNIVKGKTWKI